MGNDIRCDRLVSFNMENLFVSSEVDEKTLFKRVVYYLMYIYQRNVLDEGIFDIKEFCQLCDVNPKYAQKKVEQPYQLQVMPEDMRLKITQGEGSDFLFDSVLDNILFILAYKHLDYYDRTKQKCFEASLIIDKLEYFMKGRRGYYYVHFAPGFAERMSDYFQICNFPVVMYMCKHDCDDLYFYLLNKRKKFQSEFRKESLESDKITFDVLCSVAGISDKNTPRRRKDFLNRIITTIKDNCDFQFELTWKKEPDDVYAFRPVLTFPDIHTMGKRDSSNPYYDDIMREKYWKAFADLFRETNGLRYKDYIEPESFWNWVYNSDCNRKEKNIVIQRLYINVESNGCLPRNIDKILDAFYEQLDRGVEQNQIKFLKPLY